MRRYAALLLIVLSALLTAAPAQAAPRCTKRLVFVHYNLRVAKAGDGDRIACQGRSRRSYDIGAAHDLNAAGRYLTYLEPGDNGGSALRRLDVRTGDRLLLDRGGPAWSATFLRMWAPGYVAWATITDGDVRLRVRDESREQVLTVVAGGPLDPATFALSDEVVPYWTQDDERPRRADLQYPALGQHGYTPPAYKRSDRPRCKQNLVLLRGVVRVVRTSELHYRACGPAGRRYDLGRARAFVARGPWLVFNTMNDAGGWDLVEINVRTGERRELLEDSFNGFVDGLNPDGTVAYTAIAFPAGKGPYRAFWIWPAGEPAPIKVAESASEQGDPDARSLPFGALALAADGTLYWRDENDVLHSRRP